MPITYVTDFQGKLIPRDKARRIKDEAGRFHYYEVNVSCILMDDGQYYRTTTGKITYDWSVKKWVFNKDFTGVVGLVEDGSIGSFSDRSQEVIIFVKKDAFVKKTKFDPLSKNLATVQISEKRWNRLYAVSIEIADKYGFVESIFDGCFYKLEDCDEQDLIRIKTPNIPQNERTNTYSLDDDKQHRTFLEECYDKNDLKIPKELLSFAKKYLPYTYGIEIEVQNGFIPKRIKEPLGFRVCRDGSLGDGQEYVSIPYEGGKGLAAIKEMCKELNRRCVISNKCSVHIHFGDVRRDKLYVVSLWTLFRKIQDELRHYFPFSRTNTIRDDGKIYAALLPDVAVKTDHILKLNDDESFKKALMVEFNKIYTWLNHGHPLGETYQEAFIKETRTQIIRGKTEKQYCYRVKKFNFTTTLPRHAVQGHKWQRHERYTACNLLNLFFAHSKTIEFRIHEATLNFDKILMYMALNTAILKYAENFELVLGEGGITVKNVLEDHFPPEISEEILAYLDSRQKLFCNSTGGFKSQWKNIEEGWFEGDKKFKTKPIYQW